MSKEIKIIGRLAYSKTKDMESVLWFIRRKEYQAKRIVWKIYWLTERKI